MASRPEQQARKAAKEMPLTHTFRESVRTRARSDARFRVAMLTEAISELLAGNIRVGSAMLGDCVYATTGFGGLAKATRRPSKNSDVQGRTNAARGTTPGKEEVEQRKERLPRKP
jgi:hypothetical protein